MKNSIAIFIQAYSSSSTIILPNHLNLDVYQIIIIFSNSTIDSTGFWLLIWLIMLVFWLKTALF